ncbi:hypothetical protein [Amycolatopsis sp. BJA-103]|uniref:hypothetical protein n=1 Tax=unclassified Amycolatopsis TaxID=2618356 RepID=UPI000C76A2BC|nr:hypothetical protein [Amycolatopsis sp. BJA-103]AUI58809.1 hypothetical protein BKN51_11685 [Amycolatopsis sp. BJA-103]PNE17739.1 hypothetical protein B1H26_22885 [Amycolatopsis sp. BJA-103]
MELACPRCAQVDQVQSVPAVFQAGQTTYRVQGSMTAVPAGDGVVYTATAHRGVSVTATAAALNPYPVVRGGGCFLTLTLLMLIPAFVFVSFANDVLAENPAPTAGGRVGAAIGAWIFPFGAFALVALFAVLFVLRLRRNARIRRGIPDALEYWRQAWFCHRCGGVFFPRGDLMPAAEFRGRVWRAGGYAGLKPGR